MNKRTYLSCCIAILFSATLFSQEKTLELSLEEAINYALKNNRTVKNAALDINIAKKIKWEATAMGLPQISTTLSYQNWLKQKVNVSDMNHDGVDEIFAFGKKQSMSASATATQLLFDGSYIVGLQSAKVYLEVSKNAKVKTDLEIRKATINAYGNVLLSQESIRIYKSNIKALQKNLSETQTVFNNGFAEEEQVEQLQITLKQLESGYKNAQRLQKIASKFLNLVLGESIKTTLVLKNTLEDLATQSLLHNNNPVTVTKTIDYQIATNDTQLKKLLFKLEKAKALPTLSAFINGEYSAYNQHFEFSSSAQKWYGASLAGIQISIPVFSSFRQAANVQRAKMEFQKSKNNLTETEEQLHFQLSAAHSDYTFSIEQFHLSKENLSLATRIEQKNSIKYTEGLATSFELRQAQMQLYATQQEYLKAMLDILVKKTQLETLSNTTK